MRNGGHMAAVSVSREDELTCPRPVGMAHELPELFRYHPATFVGSLLAGPPALQAAREDAEPLVERPRVWARLARRIQMRPLLRPRSIPAS